MRSGESGCESEPGDCWDPDCDACRATREYGVSWSRARCINGGQRVRHVEPAPAWRPAEPEGFMSIERLVQIAKADHEGVFGDRACPDWVHDSLAHYVAEGRPTGDFLRAVLANDLMGAFARADIGSAKAMPAIVGYVHRHVPAGIHGSYDIVDGFVRQCAEARLKIRTAKLATEVR